MTIFDFLGPPSEDFSDGDGRIILWAGPRYICTQVSGMANPVLAEILSNWGDRVDLAANNHVDNGQALQVFHDWRQVESYDPRVRSHLVKSTSKRSKVQVYFLLKPGITTMGVSVASVFLKDLNVFTDEYKFTQVLHKNFPKVEQFAAP